MSESISDRLPGFSDRMPEYICRRIDCQNLSDRMLAYLSDGMSEYMADRLSVYMSDRLTDYMSDGISKSISDRMPTCQNIVRKNWIEFQNRCLNRCQICVLKCKGADHSK